MGTNKKSSSGVYTINYHVIWATKYRRHILNTEISKTFDTILRTICDAKGWTLIEHQVMPDHVHIFLSVTPFERPVDIIKILKGVTAKQLFEVYPEIRNVLRTGHLWSPSYYIGTAGNVSADIITKYIQDQQVKDKRCTRVALPPPFENGGLRAEVL
jgi:putative transposase